MLDNKSLKITDLRDFSWSPADNIIAYWVSENKDVPARVVLLEVPRYFIPHSLSLVNYFNSSLEFTMLDSLRLRFFGY